LPKKQSNDRFCEAVRVAEGLGWAQSGRAKLADSGRSGFARENAVLDIHFRSLRFVKIHLPVQLRLHLRLKQTFKPRALMPA
jgi:hypothetical protein